MDSLSIFTSRGRGIGIDLTSTAVHAAIVRHAPWRRTLPRVVHLGCAGLPSGVLEAMRVVDPHAAGAAIRAALPPRRGPFASGDFDIAMGLPEAALRFGEMVVEAASAPAGGRYALWRAGDEAERVTGLERGELAFDWLDGSPRAGHATVVAAPRVLVDGRIDAAAAAGAVLRLLDDEAAAAFRACRWAALARARAADAATPGGRAGRSFMLYVSEASPGRVLLAALQGEGNGGRTDSVSDGELGRHCTHLSLDASQRSLADAVRRVGAGARHAWVAGDPGPLAAAGLPCAALGALLGCAVEAFDAPRCGLVAPACPCPAAPPGRFAVAIGLALQAGAP